MLRNNIIAVIAISFITVGSLWGIGNLLTPTEQSSINHVNGILLVAENNAFNETNPDITVPVNVPTKFVIQNKDIVQHDLRVDELNINTAPLRPGQDFTLGFAATEPGTFEYYCYFHPQMRGKIIAVSDNNTSTSGNNLTEIDH